MRRRSLLAVTLGGAAAVAVPSTVQAVALRPARRSNAALVWSAIAESTVVAGRAPGSSAVLSGIVHAAMHDAAVADQGWFEGLFASPSPRGRIDVNAAVATAAYLVLAARVPAQAERLAEEYAAYLALLDGGPARQRGVGVGEAVAEAVLAARADDGLDAVVPWVQPAPGPGVFEPVATNADGSPATPVDVKLARVRPLVMRRPDQFRPAGPDPLGGERYAADLTEVAAYGRADSAVRSLRQTETARFWAENTFTQWSRALRTLGSDQRLDTAETARMLGFAHVAAADAVIACFEAKYHHLFWRPVHAVTRADTDTNPATQPDATWRPLLTVNHPEYPSAHATWSAAVVAALTTYLGTDRIQLPMDSTATGTTRTFSRLDDAAREVVDARVWAGLHFRHSMQDGVRLGRRVAAVVTDRLNG